MQFEGGSVRIIPIAGESLGTRSMATFVKTRDCSILIDPGVALCPIRNGLPAHPKEYKRMDIHWDKIKRYARKAEVLIVTHYHYDHHEPDEPEVYENKILLTKHPKKKIFSGYPQSGICYSLKKRPLFFKNFKSGWFSNSWWHWSCLGPGSDESWRIF